MTEFTIRDVPYEEYIGNLKSEIINDGLYEAVKKRCDQINGECKFMRYVQHRVIQELLSEIMDLLKLREYEED